MQANTAASRPSLSHLQLFQTPEKHGRPTPSPGPGGGPRGLPRRAGLSQTRPLPSCQAPKFRGHETSLPPSLPPCGNARIPHRGSRQPAYLAAACPRLALSQPPWPPSQGQTPSLQSRAGWLRSWNSAFNEKRFHQVLPPRFLT